jgi:site-specific DNA recombinase
VSSSVREVLLRSLYRGEIVWNRTRKRDGWGQQNRRNRPPAEWLTIPAPELRIVSESLWQAAHRERDKRQSQYAAGGRRDRFSDYLLSGFARCAECGGGFASHSRTYGRHRVLFYACTSHWKRGDTVCRNGLVGQMDAIDAEVLETLKTDILKPAIVERAIQLALEQLQPTRQDNTRDRLTRELAAVRATCERLADAIERGGPVDVLVERLRIAHGKRSAVEGQLQGLREISIPVVSGGLEQRLRAKLADWRGLLSRNVDREESVNRLHGRADTEGQSAHGHGRSECRTAVGD